MMQVGKAVGMVSLNDALYSYVEKKLVTPDEAYSKAVDKSGFDALLKRGGFKLSVPTEKPAGAAATGAH
jgi:twitching motility protein PilT